MKLFSIGISIIIILFGCNTILFGQTQEEKGLKIVKKADRLDSGFGSYSCKMEMSVKSEQGGEIVHHMRFKVKEGKGDGDKSLIVVDEPGNVEGTALMTFTHKTRLDDQWLFLKAIQRVKKIGYSNMMNGFMESEFAYADLGSNEVEKYRYTYIRQDTIQTVKMLVVERHPVDPKSGYSKQVVWYNKINYRIEQIEYYDKKRIKLKTLKYSDYNQHSGVYWRAHLMVLENHQTNTTTKIKSSDYKFKIGLIDSDFTEKALTQRN
ncbi:MAG: outer membrane lipoprotein-sorting protein [Bacteroidetes bacterium]|nr:outer membrane lipoprotein-sorting protein [Bacteroidota bacterium]